jgi:ubiquinone/menaquinone biosynthesis C-methylase UbiE
MMVCTDVRSLPLEDGCVDVVLDNNGLFHVVDAAAAIREIRRVSKTGAHLVMSAFSASLDSEDAGLREQTGGSLGFGWLIERYREAGFEVTERIRIAGREQRLPETEGAILVRGH